MEIIFGVQATDRVVKVDLDEKDAAELRKKLDEIFSKPQANELLWVTDKEGRSVGIPVDKLAYVELGSEKAERTVGFAAAN